MIKNPTLLPLPMPIRTPRLIIMPTMPEHVEEMYRAKLDSAEKIKEWLAWAASPPDLEKDRIMMAERQADFIMRTDIMLLAFTHDMRMVVSTGFHRIDWKIPRCEIGYWCRTPDEGNGYVTETANALTRYAFEVMNMRKVMIGMDVENPASENVAKRLGFIHEFDNIGGMTKPGSDELRTKRVYSRFNLDDLPPLEVSW